MDWSAARGPNSPEAQRGLDGLREVARIAEFHRGIQRNAEDETRTVPSLPAAWDSFVLLECVGRGANGELYRAWDPDLQREVALKLLCKDAAPAASDTEPLLIEGRNLARIRHPGVVTVHGARSHGTRLAQGDRVSPGDMLALEFSATRPAYLYVVNEDDRGEAYLLFPQAVYDTRNPLAAGETHRLPGPVRGESQAWGVSSAGGHEHFLVVASPEPSRAGPPNPARRHPDPARHDAARLTMPRLILTIALLFCAAPASAAGLDAPLLLGRVRGGRRPAVATRPTTIRGRGPPARACVRFRAAGRHS